MDLFLQFGYGMLKHTEELTNKWNGGTVILSPRDLKLDQMKNIQSKISNNSGNVLLDPQFYLPRGDHKKLMDHDFWPDLYNTDNFFHSDKLPEMMKKIYYDYNLNISTSAFILPGLYLSEINEDWFALHELILNEASKLNPEIPVFATICLSSESVLSQESVHSLLENLETWNVDGFYIVPEHPRNDYLIVNPNWLLNLMDLCAGLKLLNKKVIVGYSTHQSLILGLAKIDAISSGTWINVRMFTEDKFNGKKEESVIKRTTWYYCPQALSEYQIDFLGIAHSLGILEKLKANEIFDSNYSEILFRGADPTTVNFSEREAFRHYLHCLHYQANNVVKDSFDSTYNALKLSLEAAQNMTDYFLLKGVRGKYRDFSNVLDSTVSAIDAFRAIRGLIYTHNWNSL